MASVLRKIAEHELDQCFHELDAQTRDELATSLVRQWIEDADNAVLVTRQFHF
jgi:ABC-type nitrate/sulfonate/bicarbonate transport system ATPase subunit